MGKPPAFQMYAADFYMDTNDWSVEEVGIYTRLLMSAWVNGSIPSDTRKLARIAGCGMKKFNTAWCKVESKWNFLTPQGGPKSDIVEDFRDTSRLINPRMEEVRKNQAKYRESQKEKANKRWGNSSAGVDAGGYAGAMPVDMPEVCPSTSSSSSKEYNPPNPPPNGHDPDYILTPDDLILFDQVWEIYPVKIAAVEAKREWKKLFNRELLLPDILADIKKRITGDPQWTKENGRYITSLRRYLDGHRWNDEQKKGSYDYLTEGEEP